MSQEKPLVLAVDDEPVNLQLLHKALNKNFRLVPAKNGREALDKIRTHNPQVVLLDLQMPEMDGWQVLDELHEGGDLSKFRIIIVSAEGEGIAKARALSMGVRDYLTKPFDTTELVARIRMTLASRTDAEFSRDIESHVDAAIAGVQESFDTINEAIKGYDIAPRIQGHLQEAEEFFRKFMLWEKLHWAPLSLKQRVSPVQILNNLFENSYPSGALIINVQNHFKSKIFGNASWINMMFNSIIENAIQKTKAGSEVRINVSGKSKNIDFEIAYQGEPVSEEEVLFLFNPFPKEATGARPSLNMALATVGIIVQRHNGEVSHCQNGPWTKILVSLPVASAA